MIGFDSSGPINCTVSSASCLPRYSAVWLTDSQLWVTFELVSTSGVVRRGLERSASAILDLCLRCSCRCFVVDYPSRVCLLYVSCPLEAKRSGVFRIAIWNHNKIVYAIAIGAWVANITCLIHGKSLLRLQTIWSPSSICFYIRYRAGDLSIPTTSILSHPRLISTHSSEVYGRLYQTPAQSPTRRPANLIGLSHSPQTS